MIVSASKLNYRQPEVYELSEICLFYIAVIIILFTVTDCFCSSCGNSYTALIMSVMHAMAAKKERL